MHVILIHFLIFNPKCQLGLICDDCLSYLQQDRKDPEEIVVPNFEYFD